MFDLSNALVVGLVLSLAAIGCQKAATPSGSGSSVQNDHHHDADHHSDDDVHTDPSDPALETKVSTGLAKLSSEDRALAEAQKFCAVMSRERLGGMGVPLKLDIKGQTVFVCCKGCRTKALKHPDETLAKVAEMKSKNAASQ